MHPFQVGQSKYFYVNLKTSLIDVSTMGSLNHGLANISASSANNNSIQAQSSTLINNSAANNGSSNK